MAGAVDQLTEDQIQKILNADLFNLAKKVKEGKVLTQQERSLLNSSLGNNKVSEKTFAKNKAELAGCLGISRQSVYNYSKHRDAPRPKPNGSYRISEWIEFVAQIKGKDPDETLSKPQLQAKQILLQNRKLEIQNGILEKEYVLAVDVEKWTSDIITSAKTILLQIPSSLAPQVVGLTVAEAELRLKESINEALEQLHTKPDYAE